RTTGQLSRPSVCARSVADEVWRDSLMDSTQAEDSTRVAGSTQAEDSIQAADSTQAAGSTQVADSTRAAGLIRAEVSTPALRIRILSVHPRTHSHQSLTR